MKLNTKDVGNILESLALQQAAEGAQQGANHGSLICRLPPKSWQADIIRTTPEIPQVEDLTGLRRAMQDPALSVIFIPGKVIITRDIIDRICAENPLNKTIVWETD